jgi:hypothetical protein
LLRDLKTIWEDNLHGGLIETVLINVLTFFFTLKVIYSLARVK